MNFDGEMGVAIYPLYLPCIGFLYIIAYNFAMTCWVEMNTASNDELQVLVSSGIATF